MNQSARKRAEQAQTILVVEDEILIRLVIAEYLRDCGYKVIEATNAEEAVLVLKKAERAIDVVFTDIEMPGAMDGFGLSRWVRANRPHIDVILAASVARAAHAASELCDAGGNFPKPYRLHSVADRIRRLLANRKTRNDKSRSREQSGVAKGRGHFVNGQTGHAVGGKDVIRH